MELLFKDKSTCIREFSLCGYPLIKPTKQNSTADHFHSAEHYVVYSHWSDRVQTSYDTEGLILS